MSRAKFYRWAAEQPRGRYELVAGRVVAMSPEHGAHLRAKAAIWRALADAIATAGLPCRMTRLSRSTTTPPMSPTQW